MRPLISSYTVPIKAFVFVLERRLILMRYRVKLDDQG